MKLALLLGAGILAAGIVVLAHQGDAPLAFDVLVLYVGALLLRELVSRVHALAPPEERSAISTALATAPPEPERPAGLLRIERRVVLAVAHSGDLHATLAPQLRRLAAPLLAVRGVDLDREPDAARELVGDEGWELLRLDGARPDRPFDPGVPEERLTALVDSLEALDR